MDLFSAKNKTKKIPVRPGEKYHESLLSTDEMNYVYESKDDYIVFPAIETYLKTKLKKSKIKQYSSNTVPLLSKEDLKKIIKNEKLV